MKKKMREYYYENLFLRFEEIKQMTKIINKKNLSEVPNLAYLPKVK